MNSTEFCWDTLFAPPCVILFSRGQAVSWALCLSPPPTILPAPAPARGCGGQSARPEHRPLLGNEQPTDPASPAIALGLLDQTEAMLYSYYYYYYYLLLLFKVH